MSSQSLEAVGEGRKSGGAGRNSQIAVRYPKVPSEFSNWRTSSTPGGRPPASSTIAHMTACTQGADALKLLSALGVNARELRCQQGQAVRRRQPTAT